MKLWYLPIIIMCLSGCGDDDSEALRNEKERSTFYLETTIILGVGLLVILFVAMMLSLELELTLKRRRPDGHIKEPIRDKNRLLEYKPEEKIKIKAETPMSLSPKDFEAHVCFR